MPSDKCDLISVHYVLVAISGKIYAIGGFEVGTIMCSNKVEEFDPIANTWTSKATMANGRNFLSSATLDNKIYTIEGNAENSSGVYISNFTEEFRPY